MELTSIIVIALLALCLVILLWLAVSLSKKYTAFNSEQLEARVKMLQAEMLSSQADSFLKLRESLDGVGRLLREELTEGQKSLDERLTIFGDIEKQLGELQVQAKNIESVGQNIQSLSQLLRPPKARGGLGEVLLDNLLAEILPKALYTLQYRFNAGQRVDAVIKLADKLLPIDAKFPLENYEKILEDPDNTEAQKEFARSFRKHIDAIADKYIRIDEKTLDFALMFIPSEAVYSQLISQSDSRGLDYALSRKVIPTSPGHLYGFLASVSSLFSTLNLHESRMIDGSRRLLAGLNEFAETLGRLNRLQERMDGSLRALSTVFDKAKTETENLHHQLDRLRKPIAGEEETIDMEEV